MPPDVDKKKAADLSAGAFSGPKNPIAMMAGAFMAPQAAHDAVVNGTHNDKGSAEKHFRNAHAQVMGKKS